MEKEVGVKPKQDADRDYVTGLTFSSSSTRFEVL